MCEKRKSMCVNYDQMFDDRTWICIITTRALDVALPPPTFPHAAPPSARATRHTLCVVVVVGHIQRLVCSEKHTRTIIKHVPHRGLGLSFGMLQHRHCLSSCCSPCILFLLCIPPPLRRHPPSKARHGVPGPPCLHLRIRAIPCRIIRRGMMPTAV